MTKPAIKAPATRNEPFQPTASMTTRMIGTITTEPSARPAPRMLTAKPRRRSNQREIKVWKGM